MWFERRKITWPENDQPSFFSQIGKLLLVTVSCLIAVIWGFKLREIGAEYIRALPNKIASRPTNSKDKNLPTVTALLIGVWGEWHRWSYNADTMIFASFNPNNGKLTMFSIPRDLYVNITWGVSQRINYTMEYYMWKKQTLAYGADRLREKISQIVGKEIDYYAVIDFGTFEKIIDDLGGVEVSVPEKLVDTSYPVDDFNYGTLVIESGSQTMDGATALKYARSRHSTSDFDRSKRQQLIIKAVMKKLISFHSITNIRSLYTNFSELITTNANISDIIKYFPYARQIDDVSSFVLESDCPANLNQMKPGCLLYSPSRDLFGWAAVIIPYGASPSKLSYYDHIKRFVDVIDTQDMQTITDKKIYIYNSIDKNLSKKSIASALGVELMRFGFDVEFVWNNGRSLDHTYVYSNTKGNDVLLKKLNTFMSFQLLDNGAIWTWITQEIISDDNQSPIWEQSDYATWVIQPDVSYSGQYFIGKNIDRSDIAIFVGNDFVIKTGTNYNTLDGFLKTGQ